MKSMAMQMFIHATFSTMHAMMNVITTILLRGVVFNDAMQHFFVYSRAMQKSWNLLASVFEGMNGGVGSYE